MMMMMMMIRIIYLTANEMSSDGCGYYAYT